MANMSYCRFENTLRDLLDCANNMFAPTAKMAPHEKTARIALFGLVQEMAVQISGMSPYQREHGDAEAHEEIQETL